MAIEGTDRVIIEKSANGFLAMEVREGTTPAKEMFTFETNESLHKWIDSYFATVEQDRLRRHQAANVPHVGQGRLPQAGQPG